MAAVILVVVALLVTVVVLLASTPRGRDEESPLRAFRRGLRGRRHPDADQVAAARAAAVEPVDVSLGEMLAANVERGEGYVSVDELTEPLLHAREMAARVLPGRDAGGSDDAAEHGVLASR
ncbi:MAG: hypothetical protein BGO38_12220 [Cellulomonas sp. 73-145]|uniref:hypothetical protein n=1 Tax=Cellulomonas sp. 73-145 TaxID=1895739 RepID=UPI00092A2790|nr:hypothetical protein [Cellulomonas sp. 73-145]OJV59578.1 MAG: hypothetical protein BGO38_12220 [Cellulomonas sp. 73-145]